ncbi:uncharacterized protein LOC105914892 [Setaria italica]|nr:uncharacterized protein LOC105914892 [Setaria italica]
MRESNAPRLRSVTLYHSTAIHSLSCNYDNSRAAAGPWGLPHSFGSKGITGTLCELIQTPVIAEEEEEKAAATATVKKTTKKKVMRRVSPEHVEFVLAAKPTLRSRFSPEMQPRRHFVMLCSFGVINDSMLSPPIWKWFTTQGQEQEDAHGAAIDHLLVLEKELDGKRFFAGEKIGFVDLSLGPLSYVIPIYEEITGVKMITEEKLPSLSAWMGNFLSSPVVKDHLPPLDKLRLRLQAMREAFLNGKVK